MFKCAKHNSNSDFNTMEDNDTLTYVIPLISAVFKNFFLNLANLLFIIPLNPKIEISTTAGTDRLSRLFYKMELRFYQGLFLNSVTYQYPVIFSLILEKLQN